MPAQFISQANAAGATPYIEIEAWHAGPNWDQTPFFPDIASNADSADTDCTLNDSSYRTSCATWLAGIGQAVRQVGKPVIFTFAREFNVAGRYPWSQGDTGRCASSPCTPAQWIAAWDAVQAQIDSNGAGQSESWSCAGEQGQRVTGQSVVVLFMRHPAVSSRVQSSVASFTRAPERGLPRRAVQP